MVTQWGVHHMNRSEDEVILTNAEFESIKNIIKSLIPTVEAVLNTDIAAVSQEEPGLYTALIDLQEVWESDRIQNSLDTWDEDIND
jgi:hypothetical protein